MRLQPQPGLAPRGGTTLRLHPKRVAGRRGASGPTPRGVTTPQASLYLSQSPLCPGLSSARALAAREHRLGDEHGRLGSNGSEIQRTGSWVHPGLPLSAWGRCRWASCEMGHFTAAPLGVTTAPEWRGWAKPTSSLPHRSPSPSSGGRMSIQWGGGVWWWWRNDPRDWCVCVYLGV